MDNLQVARLNKAVRVVVLHTAPALPRNGHVAHGYVPAVVHNEKTPFAVVLWDTVAHKVTKIVKRYVTAQGALTAARRVNA